LLGFQRLGTASAEIDGLQPLMQRHVAEFKNCSRTNVKQLATMVAFVRAGPSAFAAQFSNPLRRRAVRADRPVAPEARLYEAICGLFITEAKEEIRSHNQTSALLVTGVHYSAMRPPPFGSDQCCHPKRKCHLSCVSISMFESAHHKPAIDQVATDHGDHHRSAVAPARKSDRHTKRAPRVPRYDCHAVFIARHPQVFTQKKYSEAPMARQS
jgi:hypothetical protein